jgi:hypothetical protein
MAEPEKALAVDPQNPEDVFNYCEMLHGMLDEAMARIERLEAANGIQNLSEEEARRALEIQERQEWLAEARKRRSKR